MFRWCFCVCGRLCCGLYSALLFQLIHYIFVYYCRLYLVSKMNKWNKNKNVSSCAVNRRWRCVADFHGVVQLAPAQGRHADRDDRGGLSQRPQADAAARDHLRRTAAQARPRQDAHPQAIERQQGAAVYREQGRPARVHWLRRSVRSRGEMLPNRSDRSFVTIENTRNKTTVHLHAPSPAPLARWTRLVSAPAVVQHTTQPIRRSSGVSRRVNT